LGSLINSKTFSPNYPWARPYRAELGPNK